MQDNDFKKTYKQNFNKIMFYAHYYLNNWYEAENVARRLLSCCGTIATNWIKKRKFSHILQ